MTTQANPAKAGVDKRFSKQQLFEELVSFMPAFANCVERLYGTDGAALIKWSEVTPHAPDQEALQRSPLWQSLGELYDYGMYGVIPTTDELGDGSLLDTELFLDGVGGLAEYLSDNDGAVPRLAVRTVGLARARQILDRGESSERITLHQVALLASGDEQWVDRHACLAIDGAMGVEDAQRLLAECPTFVPTGSKRAPTFAFATSRRIEMPIDIIRALEERAGQSRTSVFAVLRGAFADEISRDKQYGSNLLVNVRNATRREVM